MEYLARIRNGLLTLVFGSVLGIFGLVLRGPVSHPNVDVDTWARAVSGSNYFLSQVFIIFAYVIPYFDFRQSMPVSPSLIRSGTHFGVLCAVSSEPH